MQDIVAWLIALEALSWLGFPVAHLLMGRLADRGWAVARILALLLLAWVTWIGGSVGIVPNSPVGILAVLSVFVLGSVWLAHRQRSELRDFFRRRWTVVLTVELTFLAMFAFWALVISEVPAINHTEKPMDFGILSAIVSADSFPPMDSWLAGHGIAYYYGGHYVAAMLTTLTGVPTDMAYNLSIATVAALAATGVLGLVYNLLRFSGSRVSPALVVGLIAAGGVLLLGNLSGVLEFAHVRGIGGEGFWGWAGIKGLTAPTGVEGWFPDQFWWWWRGSRVIDTLAETGVSLDYTITEVPFFSFLLGDLHAHVTVLPFLLLVLTLALSMMVSPNPPGLDWIRRQPWEAAAVCLAVGALAFMNAWDFPVYLAIIGMAALLRWFSWFTPIDDSSASDSSPPGNRLAKSAGRAGLLTLGIAAAGVVLFQPFYWSFDSQAQGILPVVGPATRPFHFLVVMGVPALLATGLIIRALMEVGWPTRQQRSVAIAVAGFSIAPLLLWLVAVGIRLSVNPEDMQLADGVVLQRLALALPLLAIGGIAAYCALALSAGRRPTRWIEFTLVLAAAGFYLLAGAELFHIADQFGNRMNTVFKVYYQAWLLLGTAGAVGTYYIIAIPARRGWAQNWSALLRGFASAWIILVAFLLLASSYYPVGATLERTGWATDGNDWSSNTLAGLDFLRHSEPDEYAAIMWLNNRQRAGIIVEAVGDDYTDYGRISAATARPAVLGWEGHQRQWRGDDPALSGRRDDVAAIYEIDESARVQNLLSRYDVRWVIVGPRERNTYGDGVTGRMEDWADEGWLIRAFQSDTVTIYEVADAN